MVLLLAVLHWVAGAFYFYWTVSWFDTMMHFLGGFSLGLLAIWFIYDSGVYKKERPSVKKALFASLVVILLVGIGWEVFEYLNGLTQATEDSYPADVRNDLIADLVGAGLAAIAARWNKFYA